MGTANCPCDDRVHPAPLDIEAGLTRIPRQLAGFAEFRAAMLADIARHPPLAGFRARDADDLGVMLLEMWAVVCDNLAFYDEVHAHEAYLRTARLRASVRKLVDLLGYLPAPAVAAVARVSVRAEGKREVALPAGTAFRSGAFGDEAPQVFELLEPTKVHPRFNRVPLTAPRPTRAGESGSLPSVTDGLLLQAGSSRLEVDDILLVVRESGERQARRVITAEPIEAGDGERYVAVVLDAAVDLGSDRLDRIQLLKPVRRAALWSLPRAGGASANPIWWQDGAPRWLVLDALVRDLRSGQDVVIERPGEPLRWFAVERTEEVQRSIDGGSITEGSTTTTTVAKVAATQIKLDASLNASTRRSDGTDWDDAEGPELTVHHHMVRAGKLTAPRPVTIHDDDSLELPTLAPPPENVAVPGRFELLDDDARSVGVTGELRDGRLELDPDSGGEGGLRVPVFAHGNVVTTTRGERVTGEVLGSGDAAQAHQRFTLKKAPLTHLPAALVGGGTGVVSTLQVFVSGSRWREVKSFYGAAPDARVYTVRQDDEGASTVCFGDGVRGARLPSGVDNVVADYRHGAGAASPPAESITQLARPVKGLSSVRQGAAAFGGADAQTAESLARFGPQSALFFDRAVSIADLRAVAATVPGVRAVHCEWRFHAARQLPLVQIFYVGAPEVAAVLSETLRNVTDPTLPLDVTVATAVPTELRAEVHVDPERRIADVVAQVRALLMEPQQGLLTPERIGIGAVLHRSVLVGRMMEVPGVLAVRHLQWDGAAWTGIGNSPGAGCYFDFEGGAVELAGQSYTEPRVGATDRG